MRSQLKPSIGSPEAFLRNPSPTENGWLIADKIATLREAFQNTPAWLGFNIELKYPTDAQLAVMPTRFYSRNYFCDEVLRVTYRLYRTSLSQLSSNPLGGAFACVGTPCQSSGSLNVHVGVGAEEKDTQRRPLSQLQAWLCGKLCACTDLH